MTSSLLHSLRKSVAGILRFLILIWVIAFLLWAWVYVIVTQVFRFAGIPLISGESLSVAIGIIALAATIKIHWPIQSTDEETKDRNSRISLTLKKSIVVTFRFLILVWVISFIVRMTADVIVAQDVIFTGIPWIGGIPIDVAIGITGLVLTIKLLWPVWPTDKEVKSFFSFGSSRTSTRSTGKTASQQTGWKDPVDPEDPMEGMHMGGETELSAHETWETVEQSPYNDPDDAPGGLDTADDDGF